MPKFNQEFKPALGGWVQMDTGYQISEVRLRFPVDAGVSLRVQNNPDLMLFYIGKDLVKGIETLEQFRRYRRLDTVPRKKDFGGKGPCCEQMKLPAGTPMKIIFEPAGFQGDPEDAVTNDLTPKDGSDRLYVDNIVDWIAITHFWTPTIAFNTQGLKEEDDAAKAEGFVPWDKMPEGAYPAIRKRFESSDK